MYFAIFDEVFEGTAIMKVAENQQQVPEQAKFITLDADSFNLPSDWYLQIANEAGKVIKKLKSYQYKHLVTYRHLFDKNITTYYNTLNSIRFHYLCKT